MSSLFPAPCTVGTGGGSFPGGKVRPGRDADHSSVSSAEVRRIMIYTSSPPKPPWRVAGPCRLLRLVYLMIPYINCRDYTQSNEIITVFA
jgi:hypothetical protein